MPNSSTYLRLNNILGGILTSRGKYISYITKALPTLLAQVSI